MHIPGCAFTAARPGICKLNLGIVPTYQVPRSRKAPGPIPSDPAHSFLLAPVPLTFFIPPSASLCILDASGSQQPPSSGPRHPSSISLAFYNQPTNQSLANRRRTCRAPTFPINRPDNGILQQPDLILTYTTHLFVPTNPARHPLTLFICRCIFSRYTYEPVLAAILPWAATAVLRQQRRYP